MTLTRFISYVWWSQDCPFDIDPSRWRAMLKWFELNKEFYIIKE